MMTVPQKKYFCNRIDEITLKKVNELPSVEDLYDKAMAKEGLEAGKVAYATHDTICERIDRILDGHNHGTYGYQGSLGNISIEDLLQGFHQYKRIKHDKRADEITVRNKEEDRLKKEATRIKDVAMFGNSAEAHIMLEEFIKWK